MGSVAVEIIDRGLDEAMVSIQRLTSAELRLELMDGVGREIQSQTRHRIRTEKTSHEGAEWPANRRGASILHLTGALWDSIDYRATMDQVHVGSARIYARIHQFGGTIKAKNGKALHFVSGGNTYTRQSVYIPPRPYLGLSRQNVEDLNDTITSFIDSVLQEGLK